MDNNFENSLFLCWIFSTKLTRDKGYILQRLMKRCRKKIALRRPGLSTGIVKQFSFYQIFLSSLHGTLTIDTKQLISWSETKIKSKTEGNTERKSTWTHPHINSWTHTQILRMKVTKFMNFSLSELMVKRSAFLD